MPLSQTLSAVRSDCVIRVRISTPNEHATAQTSVTIRIHGLRMTVLELSENRIEPQSGVRGGIGRGPPNNTHGSFFEKDQKQDSHCRTVYAPRPKLLFNHSISCSSVEGVAIGRLSSDLPTCFLDRWPFSPFFKRSSRAFSSRRRCSSITVTGVLPSVAFLSLGRDHTTRRVSTFR